MGIELYSNNLRAQDTTLRLSFGILSYILLP
jgi:hypothetical protein